MWPPAPYNIIYSNVNQAWFVMYGDSVLSVKNTRIEAEDYLADLTGD